MGQVTRSFYRGLILQDPRISLAALWSAHSSYTQADPRAGLVEQLGTAGLVCSAAGVQTVGTTLELKTLEPGIALDGTFAWRLSTDSSWFGCEDPITISGWEAWSWDDGTAALGARHIYHPHAARLADGTTRCAAHVEWRTVTPSTEYHVRVFSGVNASVMVRQTSAAPTHGFHPCLVVLPSSGRLLCLSWIERVGSAQLYVSYSDNSGATWSVATKRGLRDFIDTDGSPGSGATGFDLGRIRAAYGKGQLMLLVGVTAHDTDLTARDQIWQYAATGELGTFELVGKNTATSAYFDVTWDERSQAFVVAAIPADTINLPKVWRLPSAESLLSDWTPDLTLMAHDECVDITAGVQTDGDLSLLASDDGRLFLYARITDPIAASACPAAVSTDGGRSWTSLGFAMVGTDTVGMWWNAGDGNTHPKGLAGVWHHGRVAMFHAWSASPGDEGNSLAVAYLGGPTTITLPQYDGTYITEKNVQCSWNVTWLPFDLPGDCGWTKTGAGTEVLADGALELDTVVTVVHYRKTLSTAADKGIMAKAHLAVELGGSATDPEVGLRLVLGDNTVSYQLTVCLAESDISVYDDLTGGGATQLATATTDASGGIEVLASVQGGVASVCYRIAAASDEKREWITLLEAESVTDGGAGVTHNAVYWGHLVSGTSSSKWWSVLVVDDEEACGTLAAGQTASELKGRSYPTELSYLSEGVSLRVDAGSAMTGERYDISTAYGYPIDYVFPEIRPSPREGWRSTSDASAVTIAVRLDPSFVADCAPGNDVLGLWLQGINFRRVLLQGYSGAWSTLATFDVDDGLSGLRFTRIGNTIVPSGVDGTNSPYLQFDEFKDGTFVFDDGTIRKIASNTEGQFGSGHKRPTLHLEGCDNTEPSSGTAGSLRPTWMCCLLKMAGADYSAYRLSIPAQDTLEGDFRIGTMLLGPLVLFGAESSWGRAVTTEPNARRKEALDWTRVVRSSAPARRTVQLSWSDGYDTSGAYSGDPAYVLDAAGGVAIGTTADTPFVVEGLVRQRAGPGQLVGYCAQIPYAGTSAVLNRRFEGMLAEVTGVVSIENVQGDECVDEVVRVPGLTLLEVM
jgi:hypothetical protein